MRRLEPGELATLADRITEPTITVTAWPGMPSDRNPEVARIKRGDLVLVLANPGKEQLSSLRDEVLVLAHDRLGWCSAAGLQAV